MARPTREQQTVEELFPTVAKWVQGYGHIEIGDQEMFGFVARALDYGGMPFEDDRPRHWLKHWPFWTRDWPSISNGRGSSDVKDVRETKDQTKPQERSNDDGTTA
jgi:hypothetical protein